MIFNPIKTGGGGGGSYVGEGGGGGVSAPVEMLQ